MPSFIPVEHDPFAAETQPQQGTAKLVPVEHDPFATATPKPGIPMLSSHAAPTPTISERIKGIEKWAGAETPEATGTGDFITRVIPTSVGKNVVGMGLMAKDIARESSRNPLGGLGAVVKQVPGLLRGAAISMGLRPPETETPTGPARDYGTGLPSSLEQLGERLKHQVRTNPVGVVGSVAMGKGAAKAAPGIAKSAVRMIAETQLPEKLYGSAAKMPLSRAWTKTLGEEGVSKRKAAIQAGLEGNVPISEVGIAKAKNLELAHRNAVDAAVQQLDETGTLIPKEALRPGLDEAYKTAKVEGTDAAQKFVDNLYDKRFEKMGTLDAEGNRVYQPSEIQAIKRHLYKQADYEKTALAHSLGSQLKELGNKGMAEHAKLALEELNPELKAMNQKDAAYIALTEALEKSVPRIQNANMGPLGFKILLTTHPGIAILDLISGAPRVKSAVARALYRVRKGTEPTRHQLNQVLPEVKLTTEDYDPSLRTPGEVAPVIEYSQAETSPLQYGEREIRPGFTGEAPPAEAPAAELQNLGPGFPKAAPVVPQPGRGATLIENKLMQSPQGAVYQEGYGGGTPKFDNAAPIAKAKPSPDFYALADQKKGGGVGKQFVKDGEIYNVIDVQGGPDPSIRIEPVKGGAAFRVPESQFTDWYNGKEVQPGPAPEPFKPEAAPPKLSPSHIVDITTGDGRPAEVLVNPSTLKAKKLFRMSKDKQLRYMVDKNTGDLYMWDAYDATHPEVVKQLKKSDITVDSMQGDLDTQAKNKIITSPEDIDYALKWRGKSPTDAEFLADMKAKGYVEGGMITKKC